MTTPLALRAYALATAVATPALRLWLARRVRSGKEDPARLGERRGRPSAPRPDGKLLWLHGASVGESVALLALVDRAREVRPDASILVTTGTRTAADLMARRLPPGAVHQYAPIDTPAAVRSFLNHWRPDLGVFVESELWPNLLLAAKSSGARLALLSARISEGSTRRWRRSTWSAKTLFGAFDLILARDSEEARRLESLGARIDGCIDMKFGAAPLPVDPALVASLRARWAGRRVILAASTHPGEDDIVLTAFAHILTAEAEAVLIIAPRHPERGAAVAALAADRGFSVARRAAGEEPGPTGVYVADTLGELGTWYAVADLACLGGSWVEGVGGHNPMEAARLDCPIVAGPHTHAWPVYAELEAGGGGVRVAAADLGNAMAMVFRQSERLKRMAATARAFVSARDGLGRAELDRTLALLG